MNKLGLLKLISKKSLSNVSSTSKLKKKPFNPPSETLYITMIISNQEQQLKKRCFQIGCKIKNIELKQNGNISGCVCLQVLGLLQNQSMKNGRKIKLAFIRSKISTLSHGKEQNNNSEMFDIPESEQGVLTLEDYVIKQ